MTRGKREKVFDRALREGLRGLELGPKVDRVHWSLATIHLLRRNRAGVLRHAEILLALDPPPSLRAIAGALLAVAGEWRRGLEQIEAQREILFDPPSWLEHAFFLDSYRRREFERALEHARRFDLPRSPWSSIERSAALARLGRLEEAGSEFDAATKTCKELETELRPFIACLVLDDEQVEDLVGAISLARPGVAALR